MDKLRIYVLLVPLLQFLIFELFIFFPKLIYYLLVVLLALLIYTIYLFAKKNLNIKYWYNYSILLILFSISSFLYIILLSNSLFIQIIVLISVFFSYVYLKILYYYFFVPERYKANSFENISSYGNFLVIYFIFSLLFGLQSLLSITIWKLIISVFPFLLLIFYQVFWVNKIKIKEGGIYILILSLIIVELIWSASFLPLNYSSASLALAICYYILIGITRFHLRGTGENKKIKFYLILGILSLLAILLTSKWI